MIKDMWNDGLLGRSLLALMALVVVALPLAIYGSILEEREWQDFKISENCKIVGKQKGTTSTGVGYGMTTTGQMGTVITTSSTPDTVGWLCDDGVTYWR